MQISMTEILSPIQVIRVGGKVYKINKNPQWNTLYLVDKYKEKIAKKEKYNNWLSEREAFSFLIREGIVDKDYETQLKDIAKSLDQNKKLLYQNRGNDKGEKTLRKKIAGLKHLYMDLYSRVHSLDYITFTHYVDHMGDLFLLFHNIQPKPDFYVLERINSIIQSSGPTVEDIRYIARTDPWRSYWLANRPAPFKYDVLNQEQISLILYSRMYDAIYENPECPEESVLEDDDMLDGWMILNKEKAEREKLTNELEKKNPKLKNATEVFIPAKNAQEAENISRLNSDIARAKKIAREQIIQHVGEVNDKEFAKKGLDVK
jgi:hypothetical protein